MQRVIGGYLKVLIMHPCATTTPRVAGAPGTILPRLWLSCHAALTCGALIHVVRLVVLPLGTWCPVAHGTGLIRATSGGSIRSWLAGLTAGFKSTAMAPFMGLIRLLRRGTLWVTRSGVLTRIGMGCGYREQHGCT